MKRTVIGALPASGSARKSARGARFAPPPALPPPLLPPPCAGDCISRTEPSRIEQPQSCTIVSCTGLAALIAKLVVSCVVGELPVQSAGANGMFVPSGFLQSIEKSNTPRPRAFIRKRQAGCVPSAVAR